MRKIIQIAVSESMGYDKECGDFQQSETIFALSMTEHYGVDG